MTDRNTNKRNWWDDDQFVEELKRREASFLNGTAKTYSLEEAIENARQAIKKIKEEK